jgi:hypothetical protein
VQSITSSAPSVRTMSTFRVLQAAVMRAPRAFAIWFDTPRGRRLVSYFDAMTDEVFAAYQAKGIASRNAAVISAAERNTSPLTCNGEAFVDQGALGRWIDLLGPPF